VEKVELVEQLVVILGELEMADLVEQAEILEEEAEQT